MQMFYSKADMDTAVLDHKMDDLKNENPKPVSKKAKVNPKLKLQLDV